MESSNNPPNGLVVRGASSMSVVPGSGVSTNWAIGKVTPNLSSSGSTPATAPSLARNTFHGDHKISVELASHSSSFVMAVSVTLSHEKSDSSKENVFVTTVGTLAGMSASSGSVPVPVSVTDSI